MDQPATTTPIVCDMTSAPDTGPERMIEYRRLFAQALVGRERTAEGIRFGFRAGDGDRSLGTRPGRPREGLLPVLRLQHHHPMRRGALGRLRHRQ
jgi:hypothetical protein